MGLGQSDIERQAERSLARDRHKHDKPANRANMAPLAIYMLPIIETESCKLHCFFCGNPFIEIRNKVMYISAYPHHTYQKVSADTIQCKRCKQRYTKVV